MNGLGGESSEEHQPNGEAVNGVNGISPFKTPNTKKKSGSGEKELETNPEKDELDDAKMESEAPELDVTMSQIQAEPS